MKISVIVAAYNAEKYLEETLDSLIYQSMKDYEVIVVNDGSVDHTADILNEYEKRHSIMKVIHQENGGPSAARNAGLAVARGVYIYFFDADDILELDALSSLYQCAVRRRADLVIAKYDIFDRYRTTPVNGINDLVQEKKIGIYDPRILWTFSLCNKLFKAEIIRKYSLQLPPISYSEDGAFLMNYIYHCQRITGLDKVIFHYRRMYNGEAESITASISPSKIRDYIEAHHIILKSAEKSFLRDYPDSHSLKEVMKGHDDVQKYMNEIIRKELQILLDQFYSKFWELDEDTVSLLVAEMREKLGALNIRERSILQDGHPEFALERIPVTPAEVLAQAHITFVLFGDRACSENFINCMNSLFRQNLVTIVIMVPESMRDILEENNMLQGNVLFVPAGSEKELFYYALDHAVTPYLVFGDPKISYVNNAFKYVLKHFIKSPGDFIVEAVYHRNYGEIQAVLLNHMVLESLKLGYEDNPFLCMDNTLANKFFKIEFLRSFAFDRNRPIGEYLSLFYKKGYYPFMNDGVVLFEDEEKNFIDFIGTPETIPFMREYLEEKPADLNSPELVRELNEVLAKLVPLPTNNILQLIYKKILALLKKHSVKNQVLFISIRKDGELEGNAKALYPYVKGEKVVCAKMLPHSLFTGFKLFYQVYTSRIIVTDDYLRYLRHFQLREEQRVIQLWHACGAFKKFGQRGTNMSIYYDNATHAQYNLVTVSSESIRSIYADAFNIDISKVKSLGCPRTDYFFDTEWIQNTKEKIYSAYPEWRKKKIILYAPTFRDINEDRSQFHPELDFDLLSKKLLPDQMFLICPHPVMKNSIIEGEYDNIRVIREFSTNDLMHISYMLITDYSSVIFEYALLKKPIAFFCYDLANYNRGFYLKYPEDLPGDVYETQEELMDYIICEDKHSMTEKYTRFVEKYMSACDGHSSERIADLINSYMEETDNGKK